VNGPERKIQLEVEYALGCDGWYVVRTQLAHGRGWPDTTAYKNGRELLIEFKQPGGELSPQQIKVIGELQLAGKHVVVAEAWSDVYPYTVTA
jgi:hypothetical protein